MLAGMQQQTNGQSPRFMQMYAKLPAQDVNRARAFFADKLGLKPFGEHDGHLYYEIGGAYFLIFPSSGAPSGTHDQLGLVVENLDAEAARLGSLSVDFENYPALPGFSTQDRMMHRGRMKAAWF